MCSEEQKLCFKKTFVLVNNKLKPQYTCNLFKVQENHPSQSWNDSQDEQMVQDQNCDHKCKSFDALLKHFEKKHSFYLHSAQICKGCEVIMMSTCNILSHFKQHIMSGMTIFDQSRTNPCIVCKSHILYIKSVIPHIPCPFDLVCEPTAELSWIKISGN